MQHAATLTSAFDAAVSAALALRDDRRPSGTNSRSPALIVGVDTAPGQPLPPGLASERSDIRIGAVTRDANAVTSAALMLSDKGAAKLRADIQRFGTGALTSKGRAPQAQKIAPLERFTGGLLRPLWTDPRPLPAAGVPTWWQCWCWSDRVGSFDQIASGHDCRVADDRLEFAGMTVLSVYATRESLSGLVAATDAISELRLAEETAHYWTHVAHDRQHEGVDALLARTQWAGPEAPAVCLLDTGVVREHPLLQPALDPADRHTVRASWGGGDRDPPHGTFCAGLALHGDLVDTLKSVGKHRLRHRLESVKLLGDGPRDAHAPDTYGSITRSAIALAEIAAPQRARVFSLAVTDEDVSGERPTSWSAALDQAAVGEPDEALDDDEDDLGGGDTTLERQRRLICVAAGNRNAMAAIHDPIADAAEFPTENPAQAWNALTIGGYTEKTTVEGDDATGCTASVAKGELSPYSRCSIDWPHAETAIKPELVLEAGNKLDDGSGYHSAEHPSLSLLSTSANLATRPLDTFCATSAAVSLASGMAAKIMARYPQCWPETVRALLVHSARWTPPMRAKIDAAKRTDARNLLRSFGYGVPDVDRALYSFDNDLALVTEQMIQPFCQAGRPGRLENRGRLNAAHYIELPWPAALLQSLGNTKVVVRVTLSYFIEPNPGGIGAVSAAAYRSAGLRFDLKRSGERLEDLHAHVNGLATPRPARKRSTDKARVLGENMISGGSLHSDLWEGPAVDFADRDHLVVYPVSGWWKDLKRQQRWNERMHYALVVSLSVDDESVDLYGAIEKTIGARVTVSVGA